MPPKRATRASARSESTPARRRQQTREPSSDLGLGGPAVTARRTPNPAKYSTNYGSPATIMPTRRPGTYGTNLAGAFGSVLEKVRQDNADDEREGIQREAAEGALGDGSSSIAGDSSPAENPSSEPDLPSGAGSNQASSAVASPQPSEPPSDAPAAPSNDGAGSTPFPGRRQSEYLGLLQSSDLSLTMSSSARHYSCRLGPASCYAVFTAWSF